MLVERSEMIIAPGRAEEFEAMMLAEGIPLLSALPGADSAKIGRGVENRDKFILLINWRTMEDHIAFTKAESFPTFLALVSPFSVGGNMEHFTF